MAKYNAEIDKNTKNYANKGRNEIRRSDYAVEDEKWIKDLLARGVIASLATEHKSQPFLTPILFLYIEEDQAVYFHTANVGRTRANIESNPQGCLNVSEYGRMLPHQDALEFNIEYKSVTLFGPIKVVEEENQAGVLLQKMLDKYAPHLKPGKDYNPVQPEEIKRTAVYKLSIEDWSAKQQLEDEDYPGAYYFPFPKTDQSES